MAEPILGIANALSPVQKVNIGRLINYIATTPKNTNYQIIREAIKALVLNEAYDWEALSPVRKPVLDDIVTEDPNIVH